MRFTNPLCHCGSRAGRESFAILKICVSALFRFLGRPGTVLFQFVAISTGKRGEFIEAGPVKLFSSYKA
jgi:hypothetical protein